MWDCARQSLRSLKRCLAISPTVFEEWLSLPQTHESKSSADLEATKWREFACFDLSAGLGFGKRCFSVVKLELAQRQNSDPDEGTPMYTELVSREMYLVSSEQLEHFR